MSNSRIVHVIDDDDAVRDSLGYLLRSAHFDVRIYESAIAFLDALQNNKTGCIITDVRMPQFSGLDLLRRLQKLNVAMPTIVITGHGDITLAVEAMKIGAVDFLEKPFDDEILIATVRAAFDRYDMESKHETERADIREKLATLSDRERQVLERLVAGLPNKTIAFDLGISPRTVEIYRANVMTKMAAASLSALIRMALIAGILNDPPK